MRAILRLLGASPSILLAVSIGCLLPSQGVAADLVFTGNLRFATKTFIHVRLADGRVIDAGLPKTGPLAAEAILGQYKIADQVQITCKTVSADLDPTVDYRHSLELKQIRFLRAPTPDEVAGVNASLSWKGGENLLKRPPSHRSEASGARGSERV